MSTTGERLREAMDDRGVDQSALAKAIGVTQGAISLILHDKTRRSKYLVDIAIELGVNYDWLIGRSPSKVPMYEEVEARITRDDATLIERFNALPTSERATLRSLIVNFGRPALPPPDELAQIFENLIAQNANLSPGELARALATQLIPALKAMGWLS